MKRPVSLSLVLVIGVLLSCSAAEARRRSADAPTVERKPKVAIADLEQKIHDRVNRERERKGLAPLAWDEALGRIARTHSRDMAKRVFFSHVTPEGVDFAERYRHADYRCGVQEGNTIFTGAENIAQNNLFGSVTVMNGRKYYDWSSADEIADRTVAGSMKSPGHRRNILTPRWGKAGIGVAITRDGKVYVTQNFC